MVSEIAARNERTRAAMAGARLLHSPRRSTMRATLVAASHTHSTARIAASCAARRA